MRRGKANKGVVVRPVGLAAAAAAAFVPARERRACGVFGTAAAAALFAGAAIAALVPFRRAHRSGRGAVTSSLVLRGSPASPGGPIHIGSSRFPGDSPAAPPVGCPCSACDRRGGRSRWRAAPDTLRR
jgi:hypothetical protein